MLKLGLGGRLLGDRVGAEAIRTYAAKLLRLVNTQAKIGLPGPGSAKLLGLLGPTQSKLRIVRPIFSDLKIFLYYVYV